MHRHRADHLAVNHHHVHLKTWNPHIEVAHRRRVDEAQANSLAGVEQGRPVHVRGVAVHQVGVGGAGDVGQIDRAHAHLPPGHALLDRP